MYVDLMWSLSLTLKGALVYFLWSTTVIVCTSQSDITLKFSLWYVRLKLYLTHSLCKEEVEHWSGNKLHMTMVIRHREGSSLTKLASGLHRVCGFNLKLKLNISFMPTVYWRQLSLLWFESIMSFDNHWCNWRDAIYMHVVFGLGHFYIHGLL